LELRILNAEESVSERSGASSCELERAMTIEPVVSGQQLIATLCAGNGTVNSLNWLGAGCVARDRFESLRFALQHACASIEPDICVIEDMSVASDESVSRIAPRA
jgi:hypothetical protein